MVRQGSAERRRRTLKKQLFSAFKINRLQGYKKQKIALNSACFLMMPCVDKGLTLLRMFMSLFMLVAEHKERIIALPLFCSQAVFCQQQTITR